MKRKVAKLRLSPNEEARIIREEHERRRKLRIQQVREQQRHISLQILREVEQRRQRELEQLEQELREDWERQQREKLNALQRLYQESLQLLGQGHRSAKENEPDLAAIAQREEENHVKAEERYREALKELKSQRLKDDEMQRRSINARKKALQAEKERSAKVASLPPPLPNPIQSIDSKKPCVVKKSDVSAFAATHYHMPESTVDREADTKQPNAHEGAELEGRRLQDVQREEKRRKEEQLEKARLRGKEALRREHLVQDRERLLVELEHMQQTDLLRRRQQVSQMPPQIFQPLLKRQEMREDFQRELEFAFEDMYTGERRVKGDLVVQLAPEPLPAPSTGSQDQELDVSLDDLATQGAVTTQHDAEGEAQSTEQETSDQTESSKPAPRRALKKLLDRIRSQRNQWTDHGSCVPAADSPTAITDQIPERDTTIDTGSLTSEEKSILLPTELPEPTHSPQALKTTERSTAADPPLPDVLARRIQEFEEERKRREEELDREKQQQVVLLQELEEQKAKLEQMLLEAQQEREDLRAVGTQDEPLNQPEVPVHDQEVTSVSPGAASKLVPPAREDDHTRRIKEYQQRLLEQNGIHQRSVEVARQRLEEYQRALRIRYNMTARSLLPATAPWGLIHPSPLQGAQSAHLPAPTQLSTTPAAPAYIHAKPQSPAEVPTRESDMSPSRLPGPSACFGFKPLRPDEVGSFRSDPRSRRPEVTAWLTDNIMERVTGHLPERVRPSSEPPSYKLFPTHHSASIPMPQPASDPIRATSPCITDGAPPVKRRPASHGSLRTGSLSSSEDDDDDMERQRRELLEVQRRVLEQREAVALQQRRHEEERQSQEEQRRRQEVEMEQMRQQKETLQALIHTEEQLVPEAANEALVSEDISQTRLKLLASLLRAIEESNGGTLSHLEEPEWKDGSPLQRPSNNSGETDRICESDVAAGPLPVSVLPSGLFPPPPRAAKPPVTRVRLGVMEMMTEQHELSAIQEVETPVNTSHAAGLEDSVTVPSHTLGWDLQEDSESSMSSDRTLQTPSWSSSGQRTADRSTGSGTSSGGVWRERLLIGAGTSPESSGSDSVLRRISQISSDSGRGADYSGPAVTSNKPSMESAHRPPDSDCLSSTTISTGSYITTDTELNVDADKSPLLRHSAEPGRGADSLDVSPPSAQSSYINDSSAAGRPGLAVDSLFNDSSIQHIIDRYTRELNISLSAAGKTTDSEGSYVEELGSSVSQQTPDRVLERSGEDESSTARRSPPSGAAGAQRSGLDWHGTVNPIPEHFSGEDPSLAEDQEQDSFRPLIGQLTDQSSCLAADHRDSAMERLVGQPSAHSSMIGHPPGPPVSVSFNHCGWDSTLSRMIDRLSHQSTSHWLSGGQDFYAGQLTGRVTSEQSTTWLDGGLEESRMRPLAVELDESAGQHSGSSDERTHVELGVSTEASGPSYPALPPEASSHSASVPGVNPHQQDQTLQNQTSPLDMGPERTEVFPGSDSFHPLLAEVTHNETADPSMTFHLPEHDVPTSPEGQPASVEYSVSTSSEECETHTDESEPSSEPSPERLRAEEPSSCLTAYPTLHESFSQLITSQCQPHESILMMSSATGTDVEPTSLSLSRLTMCDYIPTLGIPQPEDLEADINHFYPLSDKILEAAGEKGILEQSEITLVSLTDTTLEDHETTVTEEEGTWEDEQKARETEGSKSLLSPHETPEDKNQAHQDPVTLLEFQWGPSTGLQEDRQQKRRALLQRSSRRAEEIKAKGALAKIQPEIKAPSEAKETSKAKRSQPATCKAKMKSETQHKTNAMSKGGQTELHRNTEKADSIMQKKPQLPDTVSNPRLEKVVEVKSSTTEQRKQDVAEMHHRTQRLYEQLEEVKQQKAIRNRQQAYATHRLKAKEFHKKTLQKLRAKQTL
ncbi:centrosomal protein of 295 kDa isoform X2 [Anoplopoma fimbria]|uniref:centrosomal protein of 295 kDa isoform X2 n=1 Tax=Anoplopoma fimbria TaxID=229290 RepID=UPI0023ED8536|nr:centrosomal protein of 295 kDa isoform X2 [Anoplopoma fimbria]